MEFRKFDNQDYLTLYDFMKPIWFETYSGVIPSEQIEYLLDKYFKVENIDSFINSGYQYFKCVDEKLIGVVVYVEKEDSIYLDKLYLVNEARGKNYPKFIFDELLKIGKDITLNVNQGNERAVKCYFKNGFEVEEEQIILLEDGMINKDYRMRLSFKNR